MWSQLPPELSARIAGFLRPNELACSLRLVDRAAAAQFRDPQHLTVRLSQPVPSHAFARHWGAPGATRQLSYKQRVRLLCLTAASGSIPNMEVVLDAVGCPPVKEVIWAASTAGQLAMCEWLLQRGCPRDGALKAAAEAGQRDMCEWLIGRDVSCSGRKVLAAAARGGHVGLMEWLMQAHPGRFSLPGGLRKRVGLLCDVARGCDLATLQRLHHAWLEMPPQQHQGPLPASLKTHLLTAAAAASTTPDWRAKVEWLEGRGCRQTQDACHAAAACPDAAERLAWLRRRGYPAGREAAEAAARAGNLAALQYLHAEGVQMNNTLAREAAVNGHLSVVAWLAEAPGAGVQLDEVLFDEAAQSGSLELMAWLRERGCPWGESTFGWAALGGSEAALEWLAERGCPMGADGEPYIMACCHNDPATLRCLARLGCPWGPPGEVFERVVRMLRAMVCDSFTPELLRVLLEAGCPVDWQVAESVLARDDGWNGYMRKEVVEMLAEWRARRGC